MDKSIEELKKIPFELAMRYVYMAGFKAGRKKGIEEMQNQCNGTLDKYMRIK